MTDDGESITTGKKRLSCYILQSTGLCLLKLTFGALIFSRKTANTSKKKLGSLLVLLMATTEGHLKNRKYVLLALTRYQMRGCFAELV